MVSSVRLTVAWLIFLLYIITEMHSILSKGLHLCAMKKVRKKLNNYSKLALGYMPQLQSKVEITETHIFNLRIAKTRQHFNIASQQHLHLVTWILF